MLEQAGVYSAIDSIVHGFAGMPTKVKAPGISKVGFTSVIVFLNIPTNKESLYPLFLISDKQRIGGSPRYHI